MPAACIATSVPVDIAMPTSAAASAGASLMPSPTIATRRPPRLQLRDDGRLVLGQHLGAHLVDAELRAPPPAALPRLSPVTSTVRMPCACSAAIAAAAPCA